jgi:arylsulfatase A
MFGLILAKLPPSPDREEGVTSAQDPYGWYRKGPIGSDFHIDQVLPHLFEQSMKFVAERTANKNSKKPFFLYLALPAPHTPIVPVPPFKTQVELIPTQIL